MIHWIDRKHTRAILRRLNKLVDRHFLDTTIESKVRLKEKRFNQILNRLERDWRGSPQETVWIAKRGKLFAKVDRKIAQKLAPSKYAMLLTPELEAAGQQVIELEEPK